jgi:hypothetical protein
MQPTLPPPINWVLKVSWVSTVSWVFLRRLLLVVPALPFSGVIVGHASAQAGRPVALRGVVAIDPTSGVALPDAVIVLRAGRIEAVGPGSKVKVPHDARTLDLRANT